MNTPAPAPQPQSQVIQVAFWVLAAGGALFAEATCRATTGHSLATVIPEWYSRGDGRVAMSIMFVIGGVGFLAMASDHCRNVWVAARGRPESVVFLGDRLREGFYAAREGDASRTVFYVPHFIVHETHPGSTFHGVWKRRVLLRDPEGNLTPVRNLATWRMVFFALALLYPAAIAFVALRMRAVPGAEGERLFPLPATLRECAVREGTVVAVEDHDSVGSSESHNTKRFYRRYAVRFAGEDLPFPVHLNWSAQRYHEGNVAVAAKNLRKERNARKAENERLFAQLDAALASGAPVAFRLDEDLAPVPADARDED